MGTDMAAESDYGLWVRRVYAEVLRRTNVHEDGGYEGLFNAIEGALILGCSAVILRFKSPSSIEISSVFCQLARDLGFAATEGAANEFPFITIRWAESDDPPMEFDLNPELPSANRPSTAGH
jgi:hypothetical protein